MHTEVLDPARLTCLNTLVGMDELKGFYLAGGTALSLQMGLRISVDFDFFTQERFHTDRRPVAFSYLQKTIHTLVCKTVKG